MRLFNLRQWFCSTHPDQILQSLILQSKHSDVAAYLDQNPNNPNVKTWAKMIFSLNAAIKSEQKYFYQYYNTKQQVEDFIKAKGYEYRAEKNYRVVQIIRTDDVDNLKISLIIHPQQRKIKKEIVKSLPLHQLNAFEQHFDYIRYKNALLKQDEEQNREVIKDTILDQANPLGINLDNLLAIRFFVTIHKDDKYFLIRCALSEGKIQFHDIQIKSNLDLTLPWTQQVSLIIENYEEQYKVEFIHLPDRLQIAILNFIKSFNVEAKDAHYIELISILQQQEQYVNWLQDVHDKIKNNQFN
ncbi:hypothetical protein pb186bvf_015355 [Paramecium bursaria]